LACSSEIALEVFNHIQEIFMSASAMTEMVKESRMGALGTLNTTREIRQIDLSDFEHRKAEIADQLWHASIDVGFFQLVNHGIDIARVRQAFAMSEKFFGLPNEVKAQYPHSKADNVGWENMAQIRPSVGTPDQKESYQITLPRMTHLWPTEAELPNFKQEMVEFEGMCWAIATKVLSCFAMKLGFDNDFFTKAHDPKLPDYQSTLRLLHYYQLTQEQLTNMGLWRGGAHTDFDCLTLLFQRPHQGGLEVCPGKEMAEQAWSPVPPNEEVITCNIGDMLMRWSDDVLPSNFHRVRNPQAGEHMGDRYSIAFFAQANRDAIIQGPQKKYPPISAGDYLKQRVMANFKVAT
jgi:isopenicillin N synthase-like dioxygenase